jgi:hypothetical protein
MQVGTGYAILQPVVVALGSLAVLLVWALLVASLYVEKVHLIYPHRPYYKMAST